MKRLLFILFASVLLTYCSEQPVNYLSAELESDLASIATRSMSSKANLQPYVGKIPVTPIVPNWTVQVDSLAVDDEQHVSTPTFPTDDELTAILDGLSEEYYALMVKYDKLDELSIFEEKFANADDFEPFLWVENGDFISINMDSLVFVCTTDRFHSILADIKSVPSTIPTISAIAADPELKLFEKILLAEEIGCFCQLEEQLDEQLTRTPYGYTYKQCKEGKVDRLNRCTINYQRDMLITRGVSAIMSFGCSGSIGELIRRYHSFSKLSLARAVEDTYRSCKTRARNWWADCVEHAH